MRLRQKQLSGAQWLTTNTALNAQDCVVVDCSGGTVNVSLPENPVVGETVVAYNKDWTLNQPVFSAMPNLFSTGGSLLLADAEVTAIHFVWSGTEWAVVPFGANSGSGYATFVSDSAPLSPSQGDLWFNSETFDLSLWYSDGSDAAWIKLSGLSGNTVPGSAAPENYSLTALGNNSMAMAGNNTYPRTYVLFPDVSIGECRGGAENDFDPATGIFTAPFDGLYHITASADIYRGSTTVESYLNIDRNNVRSYTVGGFGTVAASASVELFLFAGTEVRVYTTGVVPSTRSQYSENCRLTVRYMGA